MTKFFLLFAGLTFLSNIYDFRLPDASGNSIDFTAFKGKKILLVNIATESKYISQCESLVHLQQKFQDSLVVIVVPSNSFGNEPKPNTEISDFLHTNFNSRLLVAGKTEVTGPGQSPLFRWLTNQSENGIMGNQINNDFWKFLIDERGNLMGTYVSSVDPMNDAIQSAIQMHN